MNLFLVNVVAHHLRYVTGNMWEVYNVEIERTSFIICFKLTDFVRNINMYVENINLDWV